MKIYIALLRGINVSGKKKIKMADLRAHLAELDVKNVKTNIQSGNILFQYPETDTHELEKMIKDKIKEKYDFDVPTMVKEPADFKHVIENNPFLQVAENDPKYMHITFLGTAPAPDKIEHLATYEYPHEEYVLENLHIYFHTPKGYGRAKMNNNFFEKKLKVAATTRNWKTVNKLYELSLTMND